MKKSKILCVFCVILLTMGCKNGSKSDENIHHILEKAQKGRIEELVNNMEKYTGTWFSEELILPIAIGQDTLRKQLGIDLTGRNIVIGNDYSVQMDGEEFTIVNTFVRDYSWYLNALNVGPYFAEGLIVELCYENIEKSKQFSICIAENDIYLLSYAHGFYRINCVEDTKEQEKKMLDNSLIIMVKDAYLGRYGDIDTQIEDICGVWKGGKYEYHDYSVKLEGDYYFKIENEDGFTIEINNQEKLTDIDIKDVFSVGECTEKQYYKANCEEFDNIERLEIYSEGYLFCLKIGQEDSYIVVSKVDNENPEKKEKMKLLIDNDVYCSIKMNNQP